MSTLFSPRRQPVTSLADPLPAGPGNDGESSAIIALQLFASYDRLRLQNYKEYGPCGERICIASLGSATLLRFEDVGYFNRVYAPDDTVSARLAEIEAFYEGSPFGYELIGPTYELIGPTKGSAGNLERECRRRGWVPSGRYAWLAAPRARIAISESPSCFAIRPPAEAEQELFLLSYLRGFEANPERFSAALHNMRHLFKRSDLRFLLAFRAGKPAGIGMLYFSAKAAVLCAGATVPEYRRQGCHAALLGARLRLAIEQDCESIFSWAAAGCQSHANMERAGLQTVGITCAWRFSPQQERIPH